MVRRKEKKQFLRQQEMGVATNGPNPTTSSNNITGFLWQQNRALVDLHWQIIQVNYNPSNNWGGEGGGLLKFNIVPSNLLLASLL